MDGKDPTTGRFQAGNPGGPGRISLPDCLTSRADELVAFQVEAALTGRMPMAQDPDSDEPGPTTVAVPPTVRAEISQRLTDRLFGKAKESVEHSGDGIESILALIAGRKADP